MSDSERGDVRARGAFSHMIAGLRNELAARKRSPEYIAQFWASMAAECAAFSSGKVN